MDLDVGCAARLNPINVLSFASKVHIDGGGTTAIFLNFYYGGEKLFETPLISDLKKSIHIFNVK